MITIVMPFNIIKYSFVIYLYTMKHNLHSSSSPWPFPLLSLAQITLALSHADKLMQFPYLWHFEGWRYSEMIFLTAKGFYVFNGCGRKEIISKVNIYFTCTFVSLLPCIL